MVRLGAETLSLAQVLNMAEWSGVSRYIGEAYYEGMLRGSKIWNDETSGLSSRQKDNLLKGTVKCAQAMDDTIAAFTDSSSTDTHYCRGDVHQIYSVSCIMSPTLASALSLVRTCDVLARLRLFSSSPLELPPNNYGRTYHAYGYRVNPPFTDTVQRVATEKLALMEKSIVSYFVEEDSEMLRPSPLPLTPPPRIKPLTAAEKKMMKKRNKGKKNGHEVLPEPQEELLQERSALSCSITTCGDASHSLVTRSNFL